MPSAWRSARTEERGAYTSVAQTDDASAELTAHGKGISDGELYVLHFLFIVSPWVLDRCRDCAISVNQQI